MIPGLRAPSPLSAPRPPVYSKSEVREMLSKLICSSDGSDATDLKSSRAKCLRLTQESVFSRLWYAHGGGARTHK